MHNLFKIFHFIDKYNETYLEKIDKNVSIIYRNYRKDLNIDAILKIKKHCKEYKRKFYLANNYKLAWNLDLDGYYIPAFNKSFKHLSLSRKKNFLIIGSAHNLGEINYKIKQKCELIFLSPIFEVKKKNSFLGLNVFRNITNKSKKKIIALGGIKYSNLNKINISRASGYASISMIKKRPRNKSGPFNN